MTRALEDRLAAAGPVRTVRGALESHGEDIWIVGGTVRDALLERPLRDVDIAVGGDPERLARAIAGGVSGPVFPLSEDFGAWRVIAPNFVCDVSRLQGEDIRADLARRDFTVNAMAVPLHGGELLDPHGGVADAEAGSLRVLSPAAYEADPLRALRLARLAAELGLRPEGATEGLTARAAPAVAGVAGERVFAELRRLLLAPGALDGLELAERLGLLGAVLPEVAALRGVEQSRFHHLDVYEHTLEVLRCLIELEGGKLDELFGEHAPRLRQLLAEPLSDELTRGEALRFGALLHDVGKPATRGVREGGRVTFVGHDSAGAEMVDDIFRRLRASRKLAGFVGGLTRHHLVLGFLVHERPLSRRTVYAYLRHCAPVEVEVTLLTCADRGATRGRNAKAAIAAHLDLASELMGEALSWREHGPPAPPLRGDELARELGMDPGPELGELLERLREATFAGELGDRDQALELARRLRENPAS